MRGLVRMAAGGIEAHAGSKRLLTVAEEEGGGKRARVAPARPVVHRDRIRVEKDLPQRDGPVVYCRFRVGVA
jgi:hypothetical protein